MKKSIYLISLIIIISGFTFIGCPDPPQQTADCDPGYLPCENDQTECCEVVCDEDYHLCGDDFTECCLDTTSHRFNWELWTIGDMSYSVVRGVYIVDENNVWAVGRFRVEDPDSSYDGTGGETFNVAQWDGTNWNLSLIYNPDELQDIWYFQEDDIWVCNGFPIHWDGNSWTLYQLQDMGRLASVDHIFAKSPNDIYFVGWQGSIVHYDGSSFSQIENNIGCTIHDIYGGYNEQTEKWEILAVASNHNPSTVQKIVSITEEGVTELDNNGIQWELSSIYFIPNTKYYIGGGVIYEKSSLSDTTWYMYNHGEINNYYTNKIRGAGENDILFADDNGEVIHYNGSTYNNYGSFTNFEGGNFYAIDLKSDNAVIGGQFGSKAIILMGRR